MQEAEREPTSSTRYRTASRARAGTAAADAGERDTQFKEAAIACVQNQGGSTSLLQRKLGIGYGRAARIMDQLEEAGILGPANGSKPREVRIGIEQIDEYCA